MALPSRNRIKKSNEFQKVLKKGRSIRKGSILVKLLETGDQKCRFGFAISAKVFPNATDRNRVKRILAATAQEYINNLKKGWDIVIILVKKDDPAEYEKELRKTLEQLK